MLEEYVPEHRSLGKSLVDDLESDGAIKVVPSDLVEFYKGLLRLANRLASAGCLALAMNR